MKKFAKLAIAASFACLGFAAQAGTITIDDFSVAQAELKDTNQSGGGLLSTATTGDTTKILGGVRDLYVTKTFGGDSATRGVALEVSDGILSFATDPTTAGKGIIRWDGDSTAQTEAQFLGLATSQMSLNTNLASVATAFKVTVLEADLDFEFQIHAYSKALDNSINGSIIQYTSLGAGVFTINFSDFAAGFQIGSGVDLADLDMLQIVLNSNEANIKVDLVLDDAQAVPEPTTLALVGAALLGLGAARRRKAAK